MLAFAANLRIRTRILLGFGLSLALLGGVAVYLVWSLRASSDSFDDWSITAMNAVSQVEVQRDLARAGVAVARLMASSEPDKLEATLGAARDLTMADYDALIPKLRNPVRRALVSDARDLARQYWAAFDQLLPRIEDSLRSVDKVLKPLGRSLIEGLPPASEAAASQGDQETASRLDEAWDAFKRAHIAVLDFLDSHADSDLASAREQLTAAADLLAKAMPTPPAGEVGPLLERIRGELATAAALDGLPAALHERDRIETDVLPDLSQQIQAKLDASQQTSERDLTARLEVAQARNGRAQLEAADRRSDRRRAQRRAGLADRPRHLGTDRQHGAGDAGAGRGRPGGGRARARPRQRAGPDGGGGRGVQGQRWRRCACAPSRRPTASPPAWRSAGR